MVIQHCIINSLQMSGGYEYNLTTQSQFEEMKQKNQELMEENYNLKKTLEELIKVNNQLSDTIQQFNNSEWAHSQRSRNGKDNQTRNVHSDTHEDCTKIIHGLEQQVEYFKRVVNQKFEGEDHDTILATLEELVESFNKAQKYYEEGLSAYCEEIDNLKTEWEGKIFKVEQSYFQKTRVLEEIVKQMRKKEEIVSIIEKKMNEQNRTRKLIGKSNEMDTSSERRVGGSQSLRHLDTSPKEKPTQKIEMLVSSKQLQELKQRERKLNEQLKQKDKTISVYTDLLGKLRKKLAEKL